MGNYADAVLFTCALQIQHVMVDLNVMDFVIFISITIVTNPLLSDDYGYC
jgi:hypothetical protein